MARQRRKSLSDIIEQTNRLLGDVDLSTPEGEARYRRIKAIGRRYMNNMQVTDVHRGDEEAYSQRNRAVSAANMADDSHSFKGHKRIRKAEAAKDKAFKKMYNRKYTQSTYMGAPGLYGNPATASQGNSNG